MSDLYWNRLIVTGPAPAIDEIEAAFRRHDAARRRGASRGVLSKAFGPIAFAERPATRKKEAALADFLIAAEEEEDAGFIRPYPEVVRVHFVTNCLECHREVKRLGRKFAELMFRLDWVAEDDRTGRLIVRGTEVLGEAILPSWTESLYVMPDAEVLSGTREDFLSIGKLDFLQPIDKGY
jgi:hypothetical protein